MISTKSKDPYLRQIARWVQCQRKYRLRPPTEEFLNFINDEKYKPYIESTILKHGSKFEYKMIEKCKQYIDANKELPSKDSKDKYVIQIGNWIDEQLKKYKSNTSTHVLNNFINDEKYKSFFL